MKAAKVAKVVFLVLGVSVILAVVFFILNINQKDSEVELSATQSSNLTSSMKLSSPQFEHEQSIPAKYACDGENINPPLEISDVPENAKSLVLIVDDPDAPRGDWVHWTVWNIDPATTKIEEGSLPEGAVEGITDFGKPGYGGPCPPSGTHHYRFKLYALDTILDLQSTAAKKDIEDAINEHIIDQYTLIGLYAKQ